MEWNDTNWNFHSERSVFLPLPNWRFRPDEEDGTVENCDKSPHLGFLLFAQVVNLLGDRRSNITVKVGGHAYVVIVCRAA